MEQGLAIELRVELGKGTDGGKRELRGGQWGKWRDITMKGSTTG